MTEASAASLIDLVLGLQLGPAGQETGNRFLLDGLALGSRADGALEIGLRRFEAASLQLAAGPFLLEIGRLVLHRLAAEVRTVEGRPRLASLQAASAELTGVKLQGPLDLPLQPRGDAHARHAHGGAPAPGEHAAGHGGNAAWSLGPLAAADGTIHAEIVDAHLLFDAQVKVPIRQGLVNFNEATVEHVGPDSRMGVSRLGLYVDAPNGRSYLYQFPSAPVAGVEFERRGAMLGPWVTDRGRLRLQPFAEGLLRQGPGGHGLGLTEQARLLFDRTAVSGEVRLGDGRFAAPGVQAELAGRAEGRNAIRVHSEAVGRGLAAEMASLSVRNALLHAGHAELGCDEATGVLMLRVFKQDAQLRFAFDLGTLKMAGLRLRPAPGGA